MGGGEERLEAAGVGGAQGGLGPRLYQDLLFSATACQGRQGVERHGGAGQGQFQGQTLPTPSAPGSPETETPCGLMKSHEATGRGMQA